MTHDASITKKPAPDIHIPSLVTWMVGSQRWALSAHSVYIWQVGAIRNPLNRWPAWMPDETTLDSDHLYFDLPLFQDVSDSI